MQSWKKPFILNNDLSVNFQDKQLNLYDSKTKKVSSIKRKLEPITIYVCGITPYDSAHLGHAFTYLTFDSIIRVLNFINQKTTYAQNVTDLDDPLFDKARSLKKPWREIVEEQVQIYKDDMGALNVIPPDYFVGVEENIDLVINEISDIKDFSYQLNDKTYFKKSKNINSALVSDKSREELVKIASERGGDVETIGKLDPLDPILWKSSADDEPKWQTNFGTGRPGWHIQCISLAQKYLNLPFDIQGGGKDLIYPHHSMCDEISKITKDKEFAEIYCHVGMVSYQGSKMSKSKGNLVFVHELINKGIDPLLIRLMLISKPWHMDWEFELEDINNYIDKFEQLRMASSKYIKYDDLLTVVDLLLSNLNFSAAIEHVLKVEKMNSDIDLVSLKLVMNNLFGLSFNSDH